MDSLLKPAAPRSDALRTTPAWRDVHGILLLDKPQGLSSNQALQRVRHLFQADKAGHTGSLDPLATGLLPVCFGEATKIAGYLLGARKAYIAQCRLGVTTTTEDAEGEVVQTRIVPPLNDVDIEAALAPLRGAIVQTPPVYSAIKQGGVALYKRARRGEEVQVPPRKVEVFRFDLLARSDDMLKLEVECGSGTYVRSLVRDLGEALGCGAHLTALRREWVEPFRAPQMWTLDALHDRFAHGGLAALDACLLPLEQGLIALPALHLDAAQAQALAQGRKLAGIAAEAQVLYRALDAQGQLIALAQCNDEGVLCVRRGFNLPRD
jgi:tRNA pseudouridine55 synthase